VLTGGRGEDTIEGRGGADVLRGGDGGDTLVVSDNEFRLVDGGIGAYDTLRFDGEGPFDLRQFTTRRIRGIELVDIAENGQTDLLLDAHRASTRSDQWRFLYIRGDLGDRVLVTVAPTDPPMVATPRAPRTLYSNGRVSFEVGPEIQVVFVE
jgi:hypothetical protein